MVRKFPSFRSERKKRTTSGGGDNNNQPYLVRVTNLWSSFPDRIGICSVGFCGGRKTGEAGENPRNKD